MTKQNRQFNSIMFANIIDHSEIMRTDQKKTNNATFLKEIFKNNLLNIIVTNRFNKQKMVSWSVLRCLSRRIMYLEIQHMVMLNSEGTTHRISYLYVNPSSTTSVITGKYQEEETKKHETIKNFKADHESRKSIS